MARRRMSSIDKEARLVDAQLEIVETREAELQRILDDMQRLKDSVSLERKLLEERRSELHKEKQPINWLPVELLIQIFVTFTDAELDSHQPDEVYHRSPVIVSHVCSSWRSIALATSSMWTRLYVQSLVWNSLPLLAFLARSGKALLDVVFISPRDLDPQIEYQRAEEVIGYLFPNISRTRSIAFQSQTAKAMQRLVIFLSLTGNNFTSLRSLNMSVISLGPSLVSPPLATTHFHGSTNLNLTYLRLDQLPLFNIPKHFLPNLMALELCFTPKKLSLEGPDSYILRMSQLVRFLNCTPKLEELVLSNTVPYLDVYLDAEDAPPNADGLQPVRPVALDRLRSLEWKYPYAPDVHQFLSFLRTPVLERIDVFVDEMPPPSQRADVFLLRGYHDTAAPHLFTSHRVIDLVSLRDLSFQSFHEDAIGSVLRKFTFPVLEKLELTHDYTADAPPPGLPRLESMFRDPRLPYLTHLTLCHFGINAETGRVDAMLGYLPALVALTLDGCQGIKTLLMGFTQYAPAARAVRACPRLESLALWHCADANIDALTGIVSARNGLVSSDDNGVVNVLAAHGVDKGPPRLIRPMKGLRRQGQGAFAGPASARAPSQAASVFSNMIAMQEASRPAHIRSVRIKGCALISEEQAMALHAMGVADVVWTPVETDSVEGAMEGS